MLDINEASKFLGISKSTLRRWEADGKITSYRTEGNHRRWCNHMEWYLIHRSGQPSLQSSLHLAFTKTKKKR